MSEFSALALQTVKDKETIVFTNSPVPCNRGFIGHRNDTGAFILSPWVPYQPSCRCQKRPTALYLVDFGANIAIPTGGTIEAISVALAIGGTVIPSSTMIVTPAAVEEFFNVSRAIHVQLMMNCCQTLSIVNTSGQDILVQNANIIFSRPDLAITR